MPSCTIRPLSHQRDTVRHHQCLLLIVRDHDEGNSHDVLKALELDLHLPAQLLVERGERLIQQQHSRALHQGAGQGDPLALAAGELVWAPAFQPRRVGPWRVRLGSAPRDRIRERRSMRRP